MSNKKLNTVWFVLGGTIVNLLLALISIAGLLLLVSKVGTLLGFDVATLVPFAFVGGIVISILIYQQLTKWVIVKFNLNDKLDPLFTAKHRKKKN